MPFTLKNKTPVTTATPRAIAPADRVWEALLATLIEADAGIALSGAGGSGLAVTGSASIGPGRLERTVSSFISASANSAHVEYRALGSFASPLLITAATAGPSDGSMSSGEIGS